jgi:O-antigen biosynthesis protein
MLCMLECVLIKKAIWSLKREGIIGFCKKVWRWSVFKIKTYGKKREARDILFINGCTLPHPERYRVDHQIEQLSASGLTVEKVFYENLDLELLKYYRGFVFFRCPITPKVEEFIEKAKFFNKKVFFDIDDLVVDKKYTDKIKFVREMDKEEKKLYDDGVERMGRTMEMCDYVITTTNALARELRKKNKEVFVNKNVASEEMVKLSIEAVEKVKKREDKVIIGYLSGSITHNPDFELVSPALLKIMEEFPNVELCVMGLLDLPDKFEKYKNRIIRKPFSDWKKLPEIIAGLDINLAPIEETVFNEAKSENKWTEASLCKVVTVASDFGAFKEIIEDGKTGVLCKNEKNWYEGLKDLIENPKRRKMIAENAYKKAIKEYVTTYSGVNLANYIESKLAKNIAFVLPSTNISGGVNVVLKHCEILRRNGWDVMVINMDTSDENFEDSENEVNVISEEKHDITMKFDRLVATLYTTLKFIEKYPKVNKKLYLVQNFETDFEEYGTPARIVANSTYCALEDVHYITISKWCKKWLKEMFNKNAKYAPNGIDLNDFQFKERKISKKIKVLVEGNSDDYYKNVDESFKIVDKLDKDKFEILYLSYQGKPKKWYRVDKFYHKVPHEEVSNVYSKADILLKSSILESFSYPPLEMMATGGFVVVAPNGGNIEYLKDKENCLFYEQGNIEDGVCKIEELVNNAELRKKLRGGVEKTVKTRNWEDVEKDILGLYE